MTPCTLRLAPAPSTAPPRSSILSSITGSRPKVYLSTTPTDDEDEDLVAFCAPSLNAIKNLPAHSSTLCFLPASSTTDEMNGILQENDPTSSTSSSTSYLKTKLKNLAATISPRLPDTSSTINAASTKFSLYILNSNLNGEIESIPVEGCIGAYSSNSGSFINSEDSTCIQGFNWLTSAKSSIGLIKTISFESLTLTTKLSERVLNIKTTFEECLLKCLGHDDTVNVGAGR